MRGRQVILGILWYLAGAAVFLIIALYLNKASFFQVVSASDAIVLILGAVFVGVGALTLQKVEVLRPSPATRAEGSRPLTGAGIPQKSDFTWSSITAIFGAALAIAVTPSVMANEGQVDRARGTFFRLVLDANKNGASVVIRHHDEEWWSKAGHSSIPCGRCHHVNIPGQEGTSCAECHIYMGAPSKLDITNEDGTLAVESVESPEFINDIFDHDLHVNAQGGNVGCVTCHPNNDEPRTRDAVRPCSDCHNREGNRALHVMVPEGSDIPIGKGFAPSYFRAMHSEKLCVGCHRSESRGDEQLDQCSFCHRDGEVQAPSGQ